jgi:CelD/BcsL family acetyltransferase involved in cellulose biosynthesis
VSAIEVRRASDAVKTPALVAEWEHLAKAHDHVNALFSSPTWVAHLAATTDTPLHVISIRSASGELIGIVPFRIRGYTLRFAVAARTLFRRKMAAAEILGSVPLLPEDPAYYGSVMTQILSEPFNCCAIYLDSVPCDGMLWKYLHDDQFLPRNCFWHMIEDPRPWHLVELAPTFDQYLQSMSAKARANIRREIRQFSQLANGDARTVRVTDSTQVKWFLECAAAISHRSWQHRVIGERVSCSDAAIRSFEDLAARGILRSYVLQAGEIPYAFAVGYQYSGLYHYVEIGFDERYSKVSPGKVLLSLILEDLHGYNRPRILNFGTGDGAYKRRFGNMERSDVSCLIMRKSFQNIILTRSHSSFNRGIRLANKMIGRHIGK